ncbi:MAG: multiheme c-type cytochrome [Acidiferrobacterales bacterium]
MNSLFRGTFTPMNLEIGNSVSCLFADGIPKRVRNFTCRFGPENGVRMYVVKVMYKYTKFVWLVAMYCGLATAGPNTYWQTPIPPPGEAPTGHHPLTRDLSPDRCGLCHQDTYRQWQGSIHAKAMSKGLAGQLRITSKQNVRACLTCHVPRSGQWALWEAQGASALTELHGIDCAGCHVRDSYERYGAREIKDTPHGTVRAMPLFKRSEFCIKCHQFPKGQGNVVNGKPLENTYNEWRASRYSQSGQTCQSCHMPNGKHEFKGIHDRGMTRKGLAVRVSRTEAGLHVHAKNVGAGHALPTYGTPRITIVAETIEKGRVKRAQYLIQRRLHWHPKTGWREISDTRLMPDQSIDLNLPMAKDQVATVKVIVQPDHDYHDRVYPMLLSAPVDLPSADRAMLEAARKAGIANEYTLYSFSCNSWKGNKQSCDESS